MRLQADNRRVVIIGWDGATWDLIDPWIEQGKLPNLARFRREGCYGDMQSTVPPFTYPAWTTFVTGKNPGRHGIFDFSERIPGTTRIRFVNASNVRSKTLWRLLSDAGRRVTCMGLPVSYPPQPVNGVVICGFDDPGSGNVTDATSVCPSEVLEEIRRDVGEYVTSASIMPLVSSGRYEEALDVILSVMDMKGRTARYMMEKEPWDVFMVLFGESDLAGHHFWRFIDPQSPLYTRSESERVRDGLYHVYAKLDEMLPMLLEAAPADSVKFIVSDHGFGGSGDRAIHLNNWLAAEGFLAWSKQETKPGLFYRGVQSAKSIGVRFLPPRVKTYIFRRHKGVANRMESFLRLGGIDFSRTQAFSEEQPYMQTIWINVKGRDPQGIVSPGAEYDGVVGRIRERLENWKDPITGEKVIRDVVHRDEIYDGPYVDRSPDLIVRTAYPGGYSYQGRSSRQAATSESIARIDRSNPGYADFIAAKSGSHRELGIFLAQGPAIAAGQKVHGVGLIDVAPTVLYLAGEPIPSDMDGRVLDQVFDREFVASRPIEQSSLDSQAEPREDAAYSEAEAAIIDQRLRDMGYLD